VPTRILFKRDRRITLTKNPAIKLEIKLISISQTPSIVFQICKAQISSLFPSYRGLVVPQNCLIHI